MSKTQEIKIEGSAGRLEPNRYNKISVIIEDSDIEELLKSIDK